MSTLISTHCNLLVREVDVKCDSVKRKVRQLVDYWCWSWGRGKLGGEILGSDITGACTDYIVTTRTCKISVAKKKETIDVDSRCYSLQPISQSLRER